MRAPLGPGVGSLGGPPTTQYATPCAALESKHIKLISAPLHYHHFVFQWHMRCPPTCIFLNRGSVGSSAYSADWNSSAKRGSCTTTKRNSHRIDREQHAPYGHRIICTGRATAETLLWPQLGCTAPHLHVHLESGALAVPSRVLLVASGPRLGLGLLLERTLFLQVQSHKSGAS